MADFKQFGKGVAGALQQAKQIAAAEREANLKRFLEPSKVPQRLYHGTTATEGGKGQEAIRRIKPSKEGALGSGVYMTPRAAHASGYSGIPNDEALALMAGDPYAKKMADQFMADRAAGTLREGQEGGNMLPVYAQLKNPLIIDGSGDPMVEALIKLGMDEDKAARMVERAYEQKGYIGKEVETRARAAGYDGLMQYRDGDLSEVVSYNPNAVKSAIGNQGTYDTASPDLSKAHGGGVHMQAGGKALKGALGAIKKASAEASKLKGTQDVLPAAEREENLQKFLGNSRIRERLYHATPKNFKQFKPGGDDPTMSGPAIWLTPDATKQPAAHNIGSRTQEFREGVNVMPVYAQARSPLLLDDKLSIEWAREVFADGSREFPDLISPKTIQELKKEGYDSIIHADPYGNRDGEQEILMFEPNKIKSAIGNRGTYDIEDADITKARGGQVRMAGGGKALKGALSAVKKASAEASALSKVKGTQDVLPAAERDANLAKFLEPSQVKGRMYHGTSKDFSAFDRLASTKFRRPSMDTVGSWFSSVPEKAERYAGFENRLTMPVHLNIKNPKLYAKFDDFLRDMHEAEGRDFSQQNPKGLGSAEGLREKLKAQGYDGIQFEQTDNESIYNDVMALQEAIKNARKEELGVKRVEREPFTMKRERLEKTLQETNKQFQQLGGSTEFDGHNVFVAFEPTQIKSAIGNRGTYDIEDADINKARGGLAMAGGGSIQENLKNFQNYSVLGQGAPKKPNELSGVVLAGASWLAGDEKTRLAREAFGQDVTNTAIGGQKTSDVLNQLNVFERDGGTFARGTTVVLDIGANDIAQGVDKNIIRKNLNEIVSRLGDSGVNVILSGQPEANSYDEAIKSTNLQMDDLYSDIAAKHPNVTLVDAMSGMLNQKDLMDESGFHLKDEDAKLSYINQFADVYKGANQSETGTPEQVEQVAQTNDFIDIPREIEQITQTSVPETYYAPEVVSAPVVASAPVVVETPQSDGYKWAMQGDGLETYYQNINNYLAEPRTQDEIVAAMEQYRVSQDDIDAARSFAAGHRRGGAINKARGGAINMQKGGKPGKSGALGKIAQAIQSADKEANAAIAAQKAAQVAKPGVDYADPLQPATMRMSEALGNAGAEGKTLHFTEADRSRVFGKNRGGVGFSGLQLYSKPHEEANTVWGFGNKATAEKKIRQNDPENSLFTTFVGSPTQHRSNSVVIGDAIKEFQNSVKKGVVPREQIMLMNKRLNELRDQKTGEKVFENGFDLTDPSALSVANTFSRRAAVGDVMLGLGVKGPMTRLDFKKEFPGTKFVDGSKIENILKRETDPDLVGAGTYDVGNRLFTMDGKIIERPDLNEAFPVQVTGTDLGLKYQLVPPEKAMRDFYKAREGRVDKNKKPSPVSYYDLSRAEPSQFVDENYLTFLQKEGHKTGGSVNKQPIKIKAYGKDIESKIHDEFATHINAAKGGEIKKLAWKAKGGAIKKFPWKAAQGGVPPNPSMETTQPDPTDSGTMRYAGKYAAGGRAQRFDDGGMAAQIPGQSVSAPPADPKSYPRLMAEILGRMAKDQGKEEVGSLRKPRAATDLLNRGMVAPAVGAPVDILNMGLEGIDAVRDLASGKRVDNRLASERPFLGSEHLKDVMSQYGMTTDQERPMMETALSLASPAGALKGASKAAQMAAQAKRPANPLMRRPSNLIKQPG